MVLVGWALAQSSLSVFFSSFLDKARSATIIGYLLAMKTAVFSISINVVVYPGNTDKAKAKERLDYITSPCAQPRRTLVGCRESHASPDRGYVCLLCESLDSVIGGGGWS